MQSDLQSFYFGNGAIGTFTRALVPKCPENVRSYGFSPQNDFDFSPKAYVELFPASRGAQLQEFTSGTFPIQLGQLRLPTAIGSDRKKRFFRSDSIHDDRSRI